MVKAAKTKITVQQYNNALKIIRAYTFQKNEPKEKNLTPIKKVNLINLTDGDILNDRDIKSLKTYINQTSLRLVDFENLTKLHLSKIDIHEFYSRKEVNQMTVNRLLNFLEFVEVSYISGKKINRANIFENLTKKLSEEAKKKLTLKQERIKEAERKVKERAEAKLLKEKKAKEREEAKKQKQIQNEIYSKAYKELKEQRAKAKEEREKNETKLQKESRILAEKKREVNAEKVIRAIDPIYNKKDAEGNFLFFFLENNLKPKTCEVLRHYFNIYKGWKLEVESITREDLLSINIPKFVKLADFRKGTVNDMVLFLNINNIPTAYRVDENGKLVMK